MFWFICALVLGAIAAVWFILNPSSEVGTGEYKTAPGSYNPKEVTRTVSYRRLAVVPAALAIIALLLSVITIVGTRNVGVVTTFNKETGRNLDAGIHLKAPWQAVTDIDGSIQPEEYQGEHCIRVKIADGGNACADVAYRWRVTNSGADEAFVDYRNSDKEINDAVRGAVVSPNIKAAINEVFGEYDPLEGSELSTDMTPEQLANAKVNVVPDWQQLNKDIQANVQDKIGLSNAGDDVVEVISVTVSGLALPEKTQERIDAFNKAVQDTKIALQEVATKAAQARGNKELAESLRDPNVLVAQCMDGLVSGAIQNQPGFSCWQGGGGGVVLPAVPAEK